MLKPEQFDEAIRLLLPLTAGGAGLSLGQAHERTGLAMSTLHRIATGKMQRPDPDRAKAIANGRHRGRGRKRTLRRGRFQTVSAYICNGCGNKVTLDPCNICESRRLRAEKVSGARPR